MKKITSALRELGIKTKNLNKIKSFDCWKTGETTCGFFFLIIITEDGSAWCSDVFFGM